MSVPANLVAPLFAFSVESGGQFEDLAPVIMYGHKTDAGSMANNVKVSCASRSQARALAGKGSMLEQMVTVFRKNAPTHPLYIVSIAPSGTAETRTITVGTVPAGGGNRDRHHLAHDRDHPGAAGDSADTVAAAIDAAINAYDNAQSGHALPYTSTVATNVVTMTARHLGAYAAEIGVSVPVLDGSNALTGVLTIAEGVAGAGTPDTATANAAIEEDDWSFLISAFGDATNVGKYDTLLSEVSGRWSYANQRFGIAYYPKRDSQANLISYGEGKDTWKLCAVPTFTSGGHAEPGYLWVAAMIGRVAPWLAGGATGDVNRNQTGLVVEGLTAPSAGAYWPDLATRNAFLVAGMSSWSVNGNGRVAVDKIITHARTTSGVPDTTFRDIQKPHALMYSLRYILAQLAFEHSNKVIADDNPGGVGSISTPKDIEATCYHAYVDLELRGVLENSATALRDMTVTRNADNPNRVDAEIPMDFTNPLDIFSGLARAYSQFRN
jgi:phage tail sheath gpL-like